MRTWPKWIEQAANSRSPTGNQKAWRISWLALGVALTAIAGGLIVLAVIILVLAILGAVT